MSSHQIAITGPESTGKTTLARQLADMSGGIWVEEYARHYLAARDGQYGQRDLAIIARQQCQAIAAASKAHPRLLIADTEMTVMKVWQEVVFGGTDPVIEQLWQAQHYDLYFLPHWDIPWEPDPLRENPHDREALFARYERILKEAALPYVILTGSEGDRLVQALRALKSRGLC